MSINGIARALTAIAGLSVDASLQPVPAPPRLRGFPRTWALSSSTGFGNDSTADRLRRVSMVAWALYREALRGQL
ncbi:hypothetical protein NUM_03360 [Actinocatenispora comari]|uniref:Uncharacterized protein n=1 Tax=Actinocatenispora comari TaxID=2807577 RepID=A0A8J4A574_9ACTN|nr:hypothetical protein NUM_03360 [Actinocatenispora comari]